jgi:hypothetical protein
MLALEITQTQKRIIMLSASITLVFFIIWLFIFLPVKATVDRIKTELADSNVQIQKIEGEISKTKTLAQGIQSLDTRRKVLENKFPQDVEESLKSLSKSAEKFNIKIISLKPSPKKPLLDENDKPVKEEGKSCELIQVNLVMQGSYENLIKYREMLEDNLSGFVTLEMFSIARNVNAPEDKLTIIWGFNFYLLD